MAGGRLLSVLLYALLLALLLCVAGLLPAQAAPPQVGVRLLEQAWLDDPSGQLTLAQVRQRQAQLKPYDGVLTRGYTAGATWVRLRVAPSMAQPSTAPGAPVAAGSAQSWVLHLRPALLDEVALFDPQRASVRTGEPEPVYTGDRYRLRDSSHLGLDLGFAVPPSDQPRELWLRVRSSSAHTLHVRVLTEPDAAAAARRDALLRSLGLAVLLMFVLWPALQWLVHRERLLGLLALCQVVVLLYVASFFGYGRVLLDGVLPPAAIDRLSSAAIVGVVGATHAFHLVLLREYRPRPWMWGLALSLLLPWAAAVLLLAAGRPQQALHLNMLVGLLEPALLLGLAVSAKAWTPGAGEPPLLSRRVLTLFYLAIAVIPYFVTLPFLGATESAPLVLAMPLLIGVASACLVLGLLGVRARQRVRRDLATQIALQVERQRREERERFLTMLTHELKAPLGVLRLTLDSLRIAGAEGQRARRSLDSINAILDRCRLSERLEGEQLRPAAEPVDPRALLHAVIDQCADPARVQLQEPGEPIALRTDRQLLEIVVGNLLDNALKYAPPGAPVQVVLRPQAHAGRAGMAIEVANAPGAAGRPDAQRVFGKYYRAAAAAGQSGSGLGLFLSYGIAGLLGGRLALIDDPHDVRFELWLPC